MKIFKSLKEENQWMSISDLMSVLMMIFLFISIVYIRSVNLEKNKITSIARTYETTQVEITNDLKKEFTKNLQIWNAVFDSLALSIRFENPEILFKVGSAELNDHFKSILDSFFPRFIQILTDPKYKDEYCCAAFVTSKLAEENPKAAAAFTRAVQKASQWVQENPDETAKIITEKEYVSGDVDFCAQILKTYNYKPSVQGGYDALKQNAEELTQIGVLKEGTDATKFADNAYIFFDDVPDAPESDTSTDTATESAKVASASFQPAAAAEEGDCCGGGAATKPAQDTNAKA